MKSGKATGQGRSAETWPHEYLVKKKVGSEQLFERLVEHIRTHGYEANFYTSKNTGTLPVSRQ